MLTTKWLKYQMISAYAHVLGTEPMTNALETLDFVPGAEQTETHSVHARNPKANLSHLRHSAGSVRAVRSETSPAAIESGALPSTRQVFLARTAATRPFACCQISSDRQEMQEHGPQV